MANFRRRTRGNEPWKISCAGKRHAAPSQIPFGRLIGIPHSFSLLKHTALCIAPRRPMFQSSRTSIAFHFCFPHVRTFSHAEQRSNESIPLVNRSTHWLKKKKKKREREKKKQQEKVIRQNIGLDSRFTTRARQFRTKTERESKRFERRFVENWGTAVARGTNDVGWLRQALRRALAWWGQVPSFRPELRPSLDRGRVTTACCQTASNDSATPELLLQPLLSLLFAPVFFFFFFFLQKKQGRTEVGK